MSETVVSEASYLLLVLINFVLNSIYFIFHCLYAVGKFILQTSFNVNMTDTSKKRKRNSNDQSNQTVLKRGLIDANWQKLLSKINMDKKDEKPEMLEKKNNYTGTFRRARKKNNKEKLPPVLDNLQTLNINSINLETEAFKPNEDPKTHDKKNKLTKFIAMDCEMVGVGYDGSDHMLARISLVNKFGDCVYDKYVKPREEVKDYRTKVSGIRREDLINGEDFAIVQKEVADILKGRILVGHSLKNDLSVLFLSHAKKNIRDTSKYKPFRKITKGSTPSLKFLAKEILSINIQDGEHSSVEDARAAMQLYCTVSKNWELLMSEKSRR